MSYTEGPWSAQQSDNNEYEWEVVHNERYIAVVCDEPGYGGTTEDNARLLAAAPELLEASKLAWSYLCLREGPPKAVEQIAAAIAKATAKGK